LAMRWPKEEGTDFAGHEMAKGKATSLAIAWPKRAAPTWPKGATPPPPVAIGWGGVRQVRQVRQVMRSTWRTHKPLVRNELRKLATGATGPGYFLGGIKKRERRGVWGREEEKHQKKVAGSWRTWRKPP
jgi:hypothetical protein